MNKKRLGISLLVTFAQIGLFIAVIVVLGLILTGGYYLLGFIIDFFSTLTVEQGTWLAGTIIVLSIVAYKWSRNYSNHVDDRKFWHRLF